MSRELFQLCALAAGVAGLLGSSALHATSHSVLPAASSRLNVSALHSQGNTTYDRFIVTYRSGTTGAGNAAVVIQDVGADLARAGLNRAVPASVSSAARQAVAVSYLRKLSTGAHVVRTSRKLSKAEATSLMQQIASDPAVAHVEPDVMMHAISDYRAPKALAAAGFTPDDPYYATYQWHLRAGDGSAELVGSDTTSYANKGGADIAKAWDLTDGTGVTVAVLDTGITHHPDLDTSLGDAGYDFTSTADVSGRTADGRAPGGWDLGDWTTTEPWLSECTDSAHPPEDSSWHGSHVSGTIAELTNNGNGMAGSAFGAKVLPVRVLGHCGGYTSDIADAIEWASGGHVDGVPDNANPAQVISMSLGGTGVCTATDVTGTAIADAISRGTTVVVAAGNEDADAANDSPASCPGVISVAASGITGRRAFYSNYGAGVTLAAPGGGVYANDASSGDQVSAGFVWSAINGGATVPDETDYTYGGMAGTSQATPHVSGTVALVVGALQAAGLPALTPGGIKSLLTSTARTFPSTPDQTIGAGIVDAYAAVNKAVGGGDDGGGDGAATLINGVALTGVSGAAGDSQLYKLDVPAGARGLVLRTFGGSGDVSLYVGDGTVPTVDSHDYVAVHSGNNESVVVTHPVASTYYLLVVGAKAFSNVAVQATYVAPKP
ncbi:S8 family serine peptidase [Rhodanobacter sp. Col0626]|uniref:S8 family serine peptidase n=1 Tax=Rhodanobacter sp. Col0626 TaxID=3415679 RepID=UPI003CE77F36